MQTIILKTTTPEEILPENEIFQFCKQKDFSNFYRVVNVGATKNKQRQLYTKMTITPVSYDNMKPWEVRNLVDAPKIYEDQVKVI